MVKIMSQNPVCGLVQKRCLMMVPQEHNVMGSLQEQYGLLDEQKSKQSVKYFIMSFG